MEKKIFKYFSFIATHPDFALKLRDAWNEPVGVGSRLFVLGQRLKKSKLCCKELNRQGFGDIQQRTKEAFEELQAIMISLLSKPNEDLFRA